MFEEVRVDGRDIPFLGYLVETAGVVFSTKVRCEIYSQVNQSKVERVTGRKKEGRNVLTERG